MINMLTPIEAGGYLRLSKQRLARFRLEGGGPAYHKIGSNIRYRQEDLDTWLASLVRRSTSDRGESAGDRTHAAA